jgi:outer membrane protein, heavy metal efflux system
MLFRGLITSIPLLFSIAVTGQNLLSQEQAVRLSVANQRNLASAQLSITQQQQLLGSARNRNNPEVTFEVSPYEGPIIGIGQQFNLPGVGRTGRALQEQRIQLAQLQLRSSEIELKREVRLSYLQLQFISSRVNQLRFQDSIYQAIKTASKRFFDAGQINKLEELTATTQADRVRNDLNRTVIEYAAERQILQFLTGHTDTFSVEPLAMAIYAPIADSLNPIQRQVLEQQVQISRAELSVERASLLPTLTGGLMLPLQKEYERAVGVNAGISVPIWRKQNRSRIAAAKTAVQITEAEKNLAVQRINAAYRQTLANISRDATSIDYYMNVALPQSRAIIETSQRLFQGGELNYIESLRNLFTAFEIQENYLNVLRSYNESVIQLNYITSSF